MYIKQQNMPPLKKKKDHKLEKCLAYGVIEWLKVLNMHIMGFPTNLYEIILLFYTYT